MNNNTCKEKLNNNMVQEFKLTALGPIWKSEIEDGSHLGVISFLSYFENKEKANINGTLLGTEITWNVSFDTLNCSKLWQSITEFSIAVACDNLVPYLSEPLLMRKRVNISQIQIQLNYDVLTKEWIELIWRKGGGLQLSLPPIPLQRDWNDRMIIQPFLIERTIEINTTL